MCLEQYFADLLTSCLPTRNLMHEIGLWSCSCSSFTFRVTQNISSGEQHYLWVQLSVKKTHTILPSVLFLFAKKGHQICLLIMMRGRLRRKLRWSSICLVPPSLPEHTKWRPIVLPLFLFWIPCWNLLVYLIGPSISGKLIVSSDLALQHVCTRTWLFLMLTNVHNEAYTLCFEQKTVC